MVLSKIQNAELTRITGHVTAELQQIQKSSKSLQILTQKIAYIQQERVMNIMTEQELPQKEIDTIFALIKSKYTSLFPVE